MRAHWSPARVAVLGFVGAVGLLAAIAFMLTRVPAPEEACRQQCAANGRTGRLVPMFAPAQTAGMRDGGQCDASAPERPRGPRCVLWQGSLWRATPRQCL